VIIMTHQAHEGPSSGTSANHTVVASYSTYAEAERAVDRLSDDGFPVQRIAIVGRGLHSVEQITGRLTMWGAAARGAGSGAILGLLFGWLFGLFDWVNPLISGLLLALYGAILGAVLGAVFGLIGHAMSGGRRDFSSISAMRADSYDLLVDVAVAADAAGRLSTLDNTPTSSRHTR
jgi:hypothetical protein